jgi:hypothetical protein
MSCRPLGPAFRTLELEVHIGSTKSQLMQQGHRGRREDHRGRKEEVGGGIARFQSEEQKVQGALSPQSLLESAYRANMEVG